MQDFIDTHSLSFPLLFAYLILPYEERGERHDGSFFHVQKYNYLVTHAKTLVVSNGIVTASSNWVFEVNNSTPGGAAVLRNYS
jgi:hypothetical protein